MALGQGVREELTLLEAAAFYEIDPDDLYLALVALGNVNCRQVLHANTIKTLYRKADIEDALSRLAARILGFDG